MSRPTIILILVLGLSLAANLGQYQRAWGEREPYQKRFEFHEYRQGGAVLPSVFDPVSGDLFVRSGSTWIHYSPPRESITLDELRTRQAAAAPPAAPPRHDVFDEVAP